MERRLAAILTADVVGYSRLMGADEEATLSKLDAHRQTIEGLVKNHQGRIFGAAGDSVLVEFASPVEAVRCAVEIQQRVENHNKDLPEGQTMRFRIGVNLGDVLVKGDDLLGDGVNVAARLEKLSEPGGICISGTIFDQVEGKLALDFEDLGPQEMKNIARPVRAYRVRLAENGSAKGVTASEHVTFPDKPSIAVLPFANLSGDPEQEYFSDGITEDIITGLSRFSMLFVITYHSSFAFKGQAIEIKDIGEKLGVRYIVEGSVRKAAHRLRITAQLIDAATGAQIWAERYDRPLEDTFEVQDEVTNAIVATLPGQIQSVVFKRTGKKRTESMTAYDCLLRGNWHYHLFTRDDILEARRLYQNAIEIDPQFAQAYSRLADTYNSLTTSGWETNATLKETLEAARKAVALDSGDNWARLALAWAHLRGQEFDEAEEQFEKALVLNRNDADCICWVANGFVCLGRAQDGLDLIREAIRLNPLHSNVYHSVLGNAQYFTGHFEDAVREFKQCEEVGNFNHANLAAAYGQVGRIHEAKTEAIRFVKVRRKQLEARGEHAPASNFELATPKIKRFRRQAERYLFLDGLRKAGLSG